MGMIVAIVIMVGLIMACLWMINDRQALKDDVSYWKDQFTISREDHKSLLKAPTVADKIIADKVRNCDLEYHSERVQEAVDELTEAIGDMIIEVQTVTDHPE